MDLFEIKQKIEEKLKKNLPSHVLLDRMRMIDEESRNSFAYNDPTYVWFYYRLGELIQPENMVEIGFRLGLLSGNFLRSCKSVKRFFAIQEQKSKEYYSPRLGKSNVKDNYKRELYLHVGDLNDDIFEIKFRAFSYQFAIINEESSYDKHRCYFDFLWPQISTDGIIVIDYLKRNKSAASAYKDFCMSKNIQPVYVNTNYGIGLIKKG